MKHLITGILALSVLAGCGEKKEGKNQFEVNGTIENSPASLIYLEQIPMANMQPVVVDSAQLGKDGKYTLRAQTGEAMVYNIRLEKSSYPVASVINDAPRVTVNAFFSKENAQFADSFMVKGSVASQQMKDFMLTFNTRLQQIFQNEQKGDSLQRAGAPEADLMAIRNESGAIAASLRQLLQENVVNASNPALAMILLGYYQSTAGNVGPRMQALSREEVIDIVNNTAAKFPAHKGLATIREGLQGWIGKTAPEISLPDPGGKEISLNSFRGKYVLVDFWASWCGPCRQENPNVVQAFQKFKNKNFTILGVSLDKPGQKDKWLKAIQDDQLTWTHVSDLKFWESPVVPLYKIEGIPYNVLVDPDGKIVAENLRGSALEAKLAEVLK